MDLRGRGALVTGGSGDLGTAISVSLAAAGCDVAVGYIGNHDGALLTAKRVQALDRRACTVQLDQTDPGTIDAAVARAVGGLGRLDIPPDTGAGHVAMRLDRDDDDAGAVPLGAGGVEGGAEGLRGRGAPGAGAQALGVAGVVDRQIVAGQPVGGGVTGAEVCRDDLSIGGGRGGRFGLESLLFLPQPHHVERARQPIDDELMPQERAGQDDEPHDLLS